MLLTNHHLAKMSEAAIARAYSNYLQAMAIAKAEIFPESREVIGDQHYILGYEEFKEYYILKLVGKADYVDKLVYKFQHKQGGKTKPNL